ncbi:hypothetical protein ACWD4G_37130 [Streptomyces sp. NPDC002643]
MVGVTRSTRTKYKLTEQLPWVADLSQGTVFIGVVEFAAALGLILPAATGIAPCTAAAGRDRPGKW